ncbi:MAG: hypothetical protein WCN98_11435 [Verrucomicrobiaceae bacterium]
MTVTAPVGSLAEDTNVGTYNQPEWTGHRRFASTRVYIQKDPWEVGFEQWWRARTYKDKDPAHRFIEELEIGLPGRLQLDLYYNWTHQEGETRFDEAAVEVRWALADWGKIWGNPTLYIEYAFVNNEYGGDTLESKVLLGDDFGKGWHWGLNFIFETELSQERAKAVQISGGLSKTIIDQVLSAGVEWKWQRETIAGERSNAEVLFEVGPSLQWRISKKTHLDLVALFGCTDQGPRVESFVVFGWDFGGGESKSRGGYTPTAVRQ